MIGRCQSAAHSFIVHTALIPRHAFGAQVRQHPGSAGRRAEERGLVAIAYPGRDDIFIEELLELVVRRHLVTLAAFLLQPHPPAPAVGK